MKRLICSISHNNHKVSHTPKSIMGWLTGIFEFQKMAFEFKNWYLKFEIFYLGLKIDIWIMRNYI
jgi:hypothetical protein